MQTETDMAIGVLGSKRVSWKEKNPRELVDQTYTQGMSRKELNEKVLLRVQEDFGYLPGLVEYFTAYIYRTLSDRTPASTALANRAQRAIEDNAVVERFKAKAMALSLDFMVGDKPLRDRTGTELSKLSGWVGKIGKKAGKKRVGDVFKTDAALRAALK